MDFRGWQDVATSNSTAIARKRNAARVDAAVPEFRRTS